MCDYNTRSVVNVRFINLEIMKDRIKIAKKARVFLIDRNFDEVPNEEITKIVTDCKTTCINKLIEDGYVPDESTFEFFIDDEIKTIENKPELKYVEVVCTMKNKER